MKHFYIAVFIFCGIVSLCTGSNYYIHSTIENMEDTVSSLYVSEEINNAFISGIANLKNNYYNKKNMLHIFVNKEHIHSVENNILLLENAALSQDMENCSEKLLEINNSLRLIKENLTAID